MTSTVGRLGIESINLYLYTNTLVLAWRRAARRLGERLGVQAGSYGHRAPHGVACTCTARHERFVRSLSLLFALSWVRHPRAQGACQL